MLAIQVSIGALNDAVDAGVDATAKPGKPIPQGTVGRRTALALAVAGGGAGLGLAAVSGLWTFVVALAGASLGWIYDLRLSRTPASWLPLSLALPLLPVFAWLGATGSIPPGLVTLVPVAVLAGTALAIANGLVDLERDARAGLGAVVVLLGRRRAWLLQTGLLVVVAVLAALLAPMPGSSGGSGLPSGLGGPGGPAGDGGVSVGSPLGIDALRTFRSGGVLLGMALLAFGATALAARRPSVRERGWELEALGIAAIGVGWLAGTAATAG